MYAFQRESKIYISLNVKELLAQNRHGIWSLSDSIKIWTHNHLVRKQRFNHLARLTKWLSWILSTFLYGSLDCMLLSAHVRISQWMNTLHLLECQRTLCSKKTLYLKFNWLERDLYELTKSLTWIKSTYLYAAFYCMLLSYHGLILGWIYILYFPECQGSSC